jgi:hypothetical protein
LVSSALDKLAVANIAPRSRESCVETRMGLVG